MPEVNMIPRRPVAGFGRLFATIVASRSEVRPLVRSFLSSEVETRNSKRRGSAGRPPFAVGVARKPPGCEVTPASVTMPLVSATSTGVVVNQKSAELPRPSGVPAAQATKSELLKNVPMEPDQPGLLPWPDTIPEFATGRAKFLIPEENELLVRR
jgi:hypothetical protein